MISRLVGRSYLVTSMLELSADPLHCQHWVSDNNFRYLVLDICE